MTATAASKNAAAMPRLLDKTDVARTEDTMLDRKLRTAVVQMNSTPDLGANLEEATRLVAEAAHAGARFIALPENAPYLGPDRERIAFCESIGGNTVGRFQELARKHDAVLLLGSFAETGEATRGYNTSVLIGRDGAILAHYRKIHLFDVETPAGEVIRESDGVLAGDQAVLVEVGPWRLGLSVCYDLRFPELYRELMARGANVLCVPAAFTAETGRDHWQVLLRVRAIENLCYVVAPNQFGRHFGARRSYGRSVIIDPWGTTLACCPDRPSFGVAELDLDALEATRRHFPALDHRRLDLLGGRTSR